MADLKAKIEVRAEDRSSDALEKVARGSKKIEERLAGARKELADLDRKDSAIRKFRALKAGLSKAGAEMDRARAKTAELGRQMSAAEAPTAKLRKKFEASRRKSRELGERHQRQREELRGAGVDTRSLGDQQRRIAADLERSTRGMQRMSQAAMGIPEAQ